MFPYCLKCKSKIGNKKCALNKKSLRSCKNKDKHYFIAIIAVPNTQGRKRKSRVLKTKDIKEAVILKYAFEQELINNNYQSKEIETVSQIKYEFIHDCMSLYLDYLNNVGVAEFKKRNRTKGHINDVKRSFRFFNESLRLQKIDAEILKIDQINDEVAGFYHSYLLDVRKHSNKTYNNNIATMRQFLNWLIDKKKYDIANPFVEVKRRKVQHDNLIITKEEFEDLLEVIKPENGWQVHSNGKRRYFYRDWLKTALIIALETGLRREEFLKIKFSDLKLDEGYIAIENFKVSRMSKDIKQIKHIPITKELLRVIQNMPYDSGYLIGNDEIASRESMMLFTSKAFSHFWKQTDHNKNLKLKHLRKTYLTALVQHFGDKATIISDHSNINVLKTHYVNHKEVVSKVKGFSVF